MTQNPILRAIESGRSTLEERSEALTWLLENDDEAFKLHLQAQQQAKPELVSIAETLIQAEELVLKPGELAGLSTGFHAIDDMTRGLAPSEVTVVFGYTSHGKSQFTQNIALNVAQAGTPVLLVPLEMTPAQNTARFMAMTEAVVDLPILYPASRQLKLADLSGLIQAAKHEGARLVVIDQLQQLSRSVEHQTNELSLITHTISEVAKVHDIHIILISHVSRAGAGKPPDLPDLKGSSSIEQDADMCLSVWRDFDTNNDADRSMMRVFLRKNRNRGMEHTDAKLLVTATGKLKELSLAFPVAA